MKMDYEFAKSKTLLFFFEYLIHKGRPQKLHDLTCRFGDKNFTEDMRVIVGGTVAGERSEFCNLFLLKKRAFIL